MTAIGMQRFRNMLERLLEKTRRSQVAWRTDAAAHTYRVDFEAERAWISLYHHVPPDEPPVIGALLRVDGELVITLEAQEGGDDWSLLRDLHRAIEKSVDRDEPSIESIEEELNEEETIGRGEAAGGEDEIFEHRRVPSSAFGRSRPSLRDLQDGDSPFDEES